MRKFYLAILFFSISFLPLFAEQPTTQLMEIKKIFAAAPVIYSLLFIMSTAALALWLYSLLVFRSKEMMPRAFVEQLRGFLGQENYEDAERFCQSHTNLLASMIHTALSSRKHGVQVMLDSMKSQGKRKTTNIWQKLSLLSDIAIVAPMLGLLGTVIGMFYAFYDVNRSIESINALFDGLGIAVGTTVVGLVVAIIAMIFSTTLKYKLIQNISLVENEAIALSSLIVKAK